MSQVIRTRTLAMAALLAALVATVSLAGAPPAVGRVLGHGSSGVGDPLLPLAGNGGYDVRSYDAHLRYRLSKNKLSSTTEIKARATLSPDLSRFDLDFRGPKISSLRVDGQAAAFTRDGQELIVSPVTPLVNGSHFTVKIRYSGHPKPVTDADGSHEGWVTTKQAAVALGEPQGTPAWLPSNDHPTDKAKFSVSIEVPKGQNAISNGRLVKRKRMGKWTRFDYRQKEPMATYLATITAGHIALEHGRAGGVPYLAALTKGQLKNHGARKLLKRTRKALKFERSVLGKYPFSNSGGVVVPSPLGYSLETQTRPYYPGMPSQDLAVHELAHQWFGDSVSIGGWDEIWLNEGFATYFEWLYFERHGGPTAQEQFDTLYTSHAAGDEFWNPPPGDPGSAANIFANSVYERGAMALQAVRHKVGKKDFLQTLRKWVRLKRHANGRILQFHDLAEQVSGKNLDTIFQNWLYEPGKPPPLGSRGRRTWAAAAPAPVFGSARAFRR
jgi:aminopeptidase N